MPHEQFPGAMPMPVEPNMMNTSEKQESAGAKALRVTKTMASAGIDKLRAFLPEAFDSAFGLAYGEMTKVAPEEGREIAASVRNYFALNIQALSIHKE